MTNTSAENAALIYDLQILQREIALEGEAQLASIAKVFAHNIPLYIEKLRKLEELENLGKAHTRTTKDAVDISFQLHKSGHSTMHLRSLPDQR